MAQGKKFYLYFIISMLLFLIMFSKNIFAQIEKKEGDTPKYEFILTTNVFTGHVTPVGMRNYCQLHRLIFDIGHNYAFKESSILPRFSYLLANSGIGLLSFGIPISVAAHESYGHKRYSIALGSNPDSIFFKVANEEYSAFGLIFLGYKYAKGNRAFTYGTSFVNAEDSAAVAGAGSLIQTNFAENLALISAREDFYPSDFGMYLLNKSWWTFYYFRKDTVMNDSIIHRENLEKQGIDVNISKVKTAGLFSSLASGGMINYLKSWYDYVMHGEISSKALSINIKGIDLKLPEFSTFGRGNGYTLRSTLPIVINKRLHITLITEKFFNGLTSIAGREYGLGIYYKTIENINIEWLSILNQNNAYFTKLTLKFKIIDNALSLLNKDKNIKMGFNIFSEIELANGYTFIGNDHLPGLRALPEQSKLTLGISIDF